MKNSWAEIKEEEEEELLTYVFLKLRNARLLSLQLIS